MNVISKVKESKDFLHTFFLLTRKRDTYRTLEYL